MLHEPGARPEARPARGPGAPARGRRQTRTRGARAALA